MKNYEEYKLELIWFDENDSFVTADNSGGFYVGEEEEDIDLGDA